MIPIQVYDTTLRDGEQAPGAAMLLGQKIAVAQALEQLGVDIIEAGFPAASRDDAQAVVEIAKLCRTAKIAAFARIKSEDIILAGQAIGAARSSRISLVVPVSDLHIRHKLDMEAEEVLEKLVNSVLLAQELCCEVEVIAEDATRSDPVFLCKVAELATQAGACVFTIADTVGYATPMDIQRYLTVLQSKVLTLNEIVLGIHCHDDLGLATVNTLTALLFGAREVHCTINGLGERAGNAALEEIIMAMKVRSDQYPFVNQIDTTQLWSISRLVSQVTRFPVPPNKAIVGNNVFAHGAGLHQNGILKAVETYEIMSPETVGAPQRSLPITRHSGRRGIAARVEMLGFSVTEDTLSSLCDQIKSCLMQESILSDERLLVLLCELGVA